MPTTTKDEAARTPGQVAHLLTRMRAASGSEEEGGDCSCNVAGLSPDPVNPHAKEA